MNTIEKYVFKSFLSSFVLAFLVLSFVLTIGLMIQIVGYILDGISMSLVGEFAAVAFPETIQWTVPWAILVSSVLVFSRLSVDSEIAAMRACGVNLLSVMKWPILFGLVCSLLGAWINNEVVPRGHEVRRSLKSKVSVGTGIDLLEPGVMIDDFPKVKLYFASKEGNTLRDLLVMDYSDPRVVRTIRAAKAVVDSAGRDVRFDLYNATADPIDADHPGMARALRYQHVLKDALADTSYRKKGKDMRFFELLDKIRRSENDRERAVAKLDQEWASVEADGGLDEASKETRRKQEKAIKRDFKRNRSKLKVELSKRFVFAAASLCFVLIGVPLGIQSQRRESWVGIAVSLAIMLGYYLVVMLMLNLQKSYAIHPEVLIWLPVFVCFGLAWRFISKNR